ncbi:flagellar basal body L-ring protein FlgH [Aerophototrophica crusticola]|uniref:Flagellar L-ring protein n=1 Tax=Aerophototrophica crusticola TaxID=1709002 RepID=A0A858R5E5_9PROT|nr:flagellar basal body L-ring protein FlgH [Rhodospirillaceae bacterium B3]
MSARKPSKRIPTLAVLAVSALGLSACSTAERLAEIGKAPTLAGIENPQTDPNYRPVHMPMPQAPVMEQQPNSLWRTGARGFFKDQRATRVGDILTVTIQINDRAQMQNSTTRSRDGSDSLGIPTLFGFERNVARATGLSDTGSLVSTSGASSSTGDGQIQRQEQINLRVAALITQVLPNGNLVVQGKQQVRVNHELRELLLSGIIRPEDITNANSISYEKIAEARISYGGKGTVSDVQQPRWGQQVLEVLNPF